MAAMECSEADSQDEPGPLGMWRMINTPAVILFNNLEKGAPQLEQLITSILNSKSEFTEVLVERPSGPRNMRTQYAAFNKWLLGRLFYILSVKKLEQIHAISVSTQLKTLRILYSNEASYFTEIVHEYFTCLHKLIEIHHHYDPEKPVTLKFMIPDEIKSPPEDLNLTPLFVQVETLQICQNLIGYVIQIVGGIYLSIDFRQPILESSVMEDVLHVLQNFDVILYSEAVEFYANMIGRFGYDNQNEKYIEKYFALVQCLVQNMPMMLNNNLSLGQCRKFELLNVKLTNLLNVILKHGMKHEKYDGYIFNICKIILCYESKEKNTFDDKTVYSQQLIESARILIEKLYYDNDFDLLSLTVFENNFKTTSQIYCSKLYAEIKDEIICNRFDDIIELSKISLTFKNLSSALTSALDAANCENANVFVINAHLQKSAYILNIADSFRITLYNKIQGNSEIADKIIHHEKETENLVSKLPRIYFFSLDTTNDILKCIQDIFNTIKNAPSNWKEFYESSVFSDVVTKFIIIYNNLSNKDLEELLQIQSFTLFNVESMKNQFKFSQSHKLNIFKTLLVQKMFLNNFTICQKWNECLLKILTTSLDMKNTAVQLCIIECAPLIILNKVMNANEFISEHLEPALHSADNLVRQALAATLPILVCVLSGHYAVTQANKASKLFHQVNQIKHGINVNIICLNCHKSSSEINLLNMHLLQNEAMIMTQKSSLKFSSNNNTLGRISHFEKFLNMKYYKNVSDKDVGNMIIYFSRHSIIVPLTIQYIVRESSLNNLTGIIGPLTTCVLLNEKMDEATKTTILKSIVSELLNLIKKSLESEDMNSQENCIEVVFQFGCSESSKVILASTKMLIFFMMHWRCPYGAKASVYFGDICKSHGMSANAVYHMYKKDYCKMIMELAAGNYLLDMGFASSILKVVRAFGFVSCRDFVSKDIHHALPYLIPMIVKINKVSPMLNEISSMVNCTPGDFLTERFAYIYTHIILNESKIIAEKCFQFIESVTKMPLIHLIKKHFRIILTELLLQYCCGVDKVLEACRKLAGIDPEYSPLVTNTNLTLSQVADFIQPRFLGVLAYFDSKLVNLKVALSVKRMALQSFPEILNLMGLKHMTPLRFKILATLRTALTLMEEFPVLNALAWKAFVQNIDIIALGPLLPTIFVSLLPLLNSAPKEINSIFEYLIIRNETLLSVHMGDLFFLEDSLIEPKVKAIITSNVSKSLPSDFLEKLKWYLKYLEQDSIEIRINALKFLTKLIKENQEKINDAIFSSKCVNPSIVNLMDKLIVGCRDKDVQLSEWSGRCLGELGALEPSLLPGLVTTKSSKTIFAFNAKDSHFIKAALTELVRAFQFERHTKNMDCYALAIQEILKNFKISPTGENSALWNQFPENVHEVMLPLLSSRYILAFPINKTPVHPVYGSNKASTFSEWAINWAGQLIPLIDPGPIQEVLKSVHPSLRRDMGTLMLFLPYIVLHAIISDCDTKLIQEEITTVIECFWSETATKNEMPEYRIMKSAFQTPILSTMDIKESGTQVRCSKMVYVLLDFLHRWVLSWQYSKSRTSQDKTFKKVQAFLSCFCSLRISRGNFLCGELERALLHLELYMEQAPSSRQEQLAFLAEIYSVLNEPDAVAGIMGMKQSEPTLSELILAHEVTGQLQDAATCLEKCAQQGNMPDERLRGMVEVYLGLDQPYTALRLLQGADGSDCVGALAAEPFWRLAMYDELETLLQQPNVSHDDEWGVSIGHCLLSFRAGSPLRLESHLRSARASLLRKLGERDAGLAGSVTGAAYAPAYDCALGLHMIAEIHHTQDAISKIKELEDVESTCTKILSDLIDQWNLRLRLVQSSSRTVEPVLRLRRILLEQSKELLEPSHPQTAFSLNAHIGKIWLQSAKFARKASIYQQAYIYILNGEKYKPKELFIEKAKLYWKRGQQEPAFYTLKRGLEEHFPDVTQLTPANKKICAKAKLLFAMYNDETTNVDMDVNINYYKDAMETYRQCEKSLVCLGSYYERIFAAMGTDEKQSEAGGTVRARALQCYGQSLEYGHTKLYQSMPRMISIWLDFELTDGSNTLKPILNQICGMIATFSDRLPLYLFLSAFSQIISRICHPIKEVYYQLKSIIIALILAYPQHSLWMMISVIKSSYPQRITRCQEILSDPRLKQQSMLKVIHDFNQLADKLIIICNKDIPKGVQKTTITTLDRTLPKLLKSPNFSQIMIPHEQFMKIMLPLDSVKKEKEESFSPFPPLVYLSDIEDQVTVFPSLQRPRKVTLKGSDGKSYIIMLKPKDDLRKDFRLMEFNGVVNRYLQVSAPARSRRLLIRTYCVLPLNEECGLIQWLPNLVGLRPILVLLYKQRGLYVNNEELKTMACSNSDPLSKKRKIFEQKLLPKHPPILADWFRFTFPDPRGWYQARTAYIRTAAVMSMVGYILGLGDRHGENILFDATSGDIVHVDFNCLFNKGESFEWPECVPFRLTHNMQAAMGPLGYEGTYRKCCELVMHVLREQTATLMSVIRPFVYDPLVAWKKSLEDRRTAIPERTNDQAREHLMHIEQRLQGMVRTKGKQFSLSLSPEGQVNNLILEATSVTNLCQMYLGWGPYL